MARKVLRKIALATAAGALSAASLFVGATAAQAGSDYYSNRGSYSTATACANAGNAGVAQHVYGAYYCYKNDNYPGLPPGEGPAWHRITYDLYATSYVAPPAPGAPWWHNNRI